MHRVHLQGRTPSSLFLFYLPASGFGRTKAPRAGWCLFLCKSWCLTGCLQAAWGALIIFSLNSTLKSTLNRSVPKFRENKGSQDYLASINCIAHFRLLSILPNVTVLVQLLLKFNSWELLCVYCVLRNPSRKAAMTRQNLVISLPAHSTIILTRFRTASLMYIYLIIVCIQNHCQDTVCIIAAPAMYILAFKYLRHVGAIVIIYLSCKVCL